MRKNPRLFNVIICAAILSSVPALAAEPVESPSIKSGDSWIYRSTTEKGRAGSTQTRQEIVVTRVTSSSVYWTTKEPGSTQVPKEFISPADWSRARSVNGQETVVNKPLAFPLSPGQKWDLSYSEDHPNRVHKSEQWHSKYTVVGFEPVEVPAGKFNALKIEAEGNWVAQLEPTVAVAQGAQVSASATTMVTQSRKISDSTVTGRFYKAFWYAPEVKRWVKSTEEYYGSGGERSESYATELESYKVTN
jgi:hypothetical protein